MFGLLDTTTDRRMFLVLVMLQSIDLRLNALGAPVTEEHKQLRDAVAASLAVLTRELESTASLMERLQPFIGDQLTTPINPAKPEEGASTV